MTAEQDERKEQTMTLMLEALQRIDARGPRPRAAGSDSSPQRPTTVPGRPMHWPVRRGNHRARAYEALAARILSPLSAEPSAALMFTSPGKEGGKTGVLVSLAPALAKSAGGEVLIVDADFRRPDLAHRLGVEVLGGLADVLTGVMSWQQVVRPTVLPGLSVLPGRRLSVPGGCTPDLHDFQPLLDQLLERYRLVLIDTLSLLHDEVVPMAGHCAGMYLIVRLGQTPRRAARAAAKAIRSRGGRLLGSIVLGC